MIYRNLDTSIISHVTHAQLNRMLHDGKGIVYADSRTALVEVCSTLAEVVKAVRADHPEVRDLVQSRPLVSDVVESVLIGEQMARKNPFDDANRNITSDGAVLVRSKGC